MTPRRLPKVPALLLALLGAARLPAAAAAAPAGPQEQGTALLRSAVAALFGQSSGSAEARSLAEQARESFRGISDPADSAYWQARALYVAGVAERGLDAPKAAQARFEESRKLAESSLAARESSDAWRLIADNVSQLMLVNGILYTITTGRTIRIDAEKALALQPGNPKAQLTLALWFLNAPGFAGGSVPKALESLGRLRLRADLEDEDRFAVRVWLAMASSKLRDTAAARRYLAEAAEVYPENSWIRDIEKGLQ